MAWNFIVLFSTAFNKQLRAIFYANPFFIGQ